MGAPEGAPGRGLTRQETLTTGGGVVPPLRWARWEEGPPCAGRCGGRVLGNGLEGSGSPPPPG